jgi:uracil phosphoribosyltransferase
MKCELFEKNPKYRIYKVNGIENINAYIFCCESARKILYNPHLVGKKLQDRIEKLSCDFLSAIKKEFKNVKRENVCELVFLSGGLYYALNFGFKRVFGFAPQQCFIGIQRQRIEFTEGQFRAISGYQNFESLPDNAHIIIGDTIATGATLIKGVQLLLDEAEEKNKKIESITIFTIAGSSYGLKLFSEFAEKILRRFTSCKINFYACEMFFHLMPDGTDLRFLMPDSIYPQESMQEAKKRYGEYFSKNMKCAVFDWGTRCKNPKAHLIEFIEYAKTEMKKDLDKKGKKLISKMLQEAQQELSEMKKEI